MAKEWSNIKTSNDIILVTFGGASGSTGDDITYLAKDIYNDNSDRVYYGCGVAPATSFNKQASKAYTNIVVAYSSMLVQGKTPKIILVGKSMGGCILHKVAELLYIGDIDVDLFIGVDMSCWVKYHYRKYKTYSGNYERQARYFHRNVKKLYNFYQDQAGGQGGHPAIYHNGHLNEAAINFDVNSVYFDIKTRKRASRGPFEDSGLKCENINLDEIKLLSSVIENNKRIDTYKLLIGYSFEHLFKLCACEDNNNGVGHMEIDSCENLIKLIKRIIKEEINFPIYTDPTNKPKYVLYHDTLTGRSESQLVKGEGDLDFYNDKKVINTRFEIDPINDTYQRGVRVNIHPYMCLTGTVINLKKPFTCITPKVEINPLFAPLIVCSEGIKTIGKDDYRPYNSNNAQLKPTEEEITRNCNRLIYVRETNAPGKDKSILTQIANECESLPEIDPGYVLAIDDIPRYTYVWGFINKRIYCDFKESNFLGDIEQRKIEFQYKTNNMDEFVEYQNPVLINTNQMKNYKIFNGFAEENFDEDRIIKIIFTVEDELGQNDSSKLFLYAKSIIKYELPEFSQFDVVGGIGIDDYLTPLITSMVTSNLIASKRLTPGSKVDNLKKILSKDVGSKLSELTKKSAIKRKIGNYQKASKNIFNDGIKIIENATNKSEAISNCYIHYNKKLDELIKKKVDILRNSLKSEFKKGKTTDSIISRLRH